LMVSGIAGALVILVNVVRAYVRRRRVHVTIATTLTKDRATSG